MNISASLLNNLRLLLDGNSVAASALRKDFAEILLDEELLTVKTKGSKRSYKAIDTEKLSNFLKSRFEEFRDESLLENIVKGDDLTRAEMASTTGNSKLVKVRSCPGFLVNSYKPIDCKLNGKSFEINPPEGSFVFVADWQSFEIPSDTVVVGIENMENFRMIQKQKDLFETEVSLDKPILFVSRYPQSTDLRKWLESVENQYVHFGDFDLAGISIFLTEFKKYIGDRASFLIPKDVENRIANGSTERYNYQFNSFKNLHSTDLKLHDLIDVINRYRKCYDQEGYIKTEISNKI